MKYTLIQDDVLVRYRVELCDGSKCRNDWSRTHAHVRERRVCKWKRANSLPATFTLLHEVGHIETTKSWMRRAEAEYHATVWALERCAEYGLNVPDRIVRLYQDYIDQEVERGRARGGAGYEAMDLRAVMGGEGRA